MTVNLESFPNMDEEVMLVDEFNNELGKVTRYQMRRDNLWHRSANVVVIDSLKDPHIFIHKRTDLKEVFPSYFDVSFGGVLAYNESYLTSAKRELFEESGLDVPADKLIEIGDYKNNNDASRCYYKFYLLVIDCKIEDFKCQESEVSFIERVSLSDVEKRMKTEPFMPKCGIILKFLKEFLSKNQYNS